MEQDQTKVIIKSIKRTFGTSFEEIKSRCRTKDLFFARCAFANLLTGIGKSLHKTGDYIERDHSTVAYYKSQHPILMKQSRFYRDCFNECLNDLAILQS